MVAKKQMGKSYRCLSVQAGEHTHFAGLDGGPSRHNIVTTTTRRINGRREIWRGEDYYGIWRGVLEGLQNQLVASRSWCGRQHICGGHPAAAGITDAVVCQAAERRLRRGLSWRAVVLLLRRSQK